MKTVNRLATLVLTILLSSMVLGCIDEEDYDNTPQGNFEALWRIIDEHYCFFDYKQKQYGLNWQEVYNNYKVRVNSSMTDEQLFEVLGNMLACLRDGHVNLSAVHDYARYWSWQEDYPANYSDSLIRRYLSTDYKIASGLTYRLLDDNIGYISYDSFQKQIGEGNLDEVLMYFAFANGLIIDIRNNGGGLLTISEKLAARFTDQRTLVGYLQHKTGKGHDDFSDMEPQYIEPSENLRWHKPVVVLTNRSVFSAANEFVKYMKCFPNVSIVGDKTGGGAGMPYSNTLPNGWNVRFSSVPMYDNQKQSTEFGIEPDYTIMLTSEDFLNGKDTIIEFARKLLVERK